MLQAEQLAQQMMTDHATLILWNHSMESDLRININLLPLSVTIAVAIIVLMHI